MTEPLREIAGPAGPLETLLDLPAGEPRAVAVFGHPHPLHGGTMHTKVVYQSSKALARIGVAVLRFNFRGVGRSAGTHDGGPGEMDDYRAALDFMAERYSGQAAVGGWLLVRIVDRVERRAWTTRACRCCSASGCRWIASTSVPCGRAHRRSS